jgi:hypothetical protein
MKAIKIALSKKLFHAQIIVSIVNKILYAFNVKQVLRFLIKWK